MVKLSPQIQAFAEALEEIHGQELKRSFAVPAEQKIAPVASISTVHKRAAILAQAVGKGDGVQLAAIRLGYAAFACHLVGKDVLPAQGELFRSAQSTDFTEHLKEEERLRRELEEEAAAAKEDMTDTGEEEEEEETEETNGEVRSGTTTAEA